MQKKKEEDEIKENVIFRREEKDKDKDKDKENSEKNKNNVNETIKSLFEWDSQRKQKIKEKKEEEEKTIETSYDYVPKINEKSIELAEKNQLKIKEPNVFLRLAGHDQILKEKKRILIEMYTPSFQPRSYVPRNMNLEKLKKKNYLSQRENQYEEEEEEEEEEGKKVVIKWFDNNKNSNELNRPVIILAGTKSDLEQKEVKMEDIEKLKQYLNCEYFETSSKNGNGVDDLFFFMAKELFEKIGINQKIKGSGFKLENKRINEDEKACNSKFACC